MSFSSSFQISYQTFSPKSSFLVYKIDSTFREESCTLFQDSSFWLFKVPISLNKECAFRETVEEKATGPGPVAKKSFEGLKLNRDEFSSLCEIFERIDEFILR